jgi:hypothetical protein
VLFPLDGESFWPRNSTHPVTRPNAFVVLTLYQLWGYCISDNPISHVPSRSVIFGNFVV